MGLEEFYYYYYYYVCFHFSYGIEITMLKATIPGK